LEDQLYSQSATGQMVRIDPQGRQISRVRMSKKEKLKLRKELHKINEMDSHELANKIVEKVESVPVVNPKTDEQLKIEQGEIEQRA
jgi:DNA topoisomerase VI subunit B